jgi:hypothetical protein
MKASAAAVNGALAVAGLLAAYATWQRPKETSNNDNVTVLEATKSTLGRIRYEDGARILEVFQVEGEKAVWLRQEQLPGTLTRVAPPNSLQEDGGAFDAGVVPEARPAPIEPPREMRGNERADALLLRFTPFEAVRALGKLAADKQKELGLEGTVRKLTITVSGQPHVYAVSNPQPGMVGTYLRDEKDGTVYLLTGSLMSELEPSSQALIDRRLHTFRAPDFDEFVIGYDGSKHAYLQKDAEIPQTMKVAAKATPDKPDDLVRNWHDKVWNRLIVTEVLGKGELPKAGEPKVEMRIDYLARGSSKGFIELAKSGAGDLWARTENTASWVGLHTGTDDVIAEAKKFTGPSKP